MHADHGVQFTSWSFGENIRSAGLMPSFGPVGDGLENAMIDSFWSSMQIELLNRHRWRAPSRASERHVCNASVGNKCDDADHSLPEGLFVG